MKLQDLRENPSNSKGDCPLQGKYCKRQKHNSNKWSQLKEPRRNWTSIGRREDPSPTQWKEVELPNLPAQKVVPLGRMNKSGEQLAQRKAKTAKLAASCLTVGRKIVALAHCLLCSDSVTQET